MPLRHRTQAELAPDPERRPNPQRRPPHELPRRDAVPVPARERDPARERGDTVCKRLCVTLQAIYMTEPALRDALRRHPALADEGGRQGGAVPRSLYRRHRRAPGQRPAPQGHQVRKDAHRPRGGADGRCRPGGLRPGVPTGRVESAVPAHRRQGRRSSVSRRDVLALATTARASSANVAAQTANVVIGGLPRTSAGPVPGQGWPWLGIRQGRCPHTPLRIGFHQAREGVASAPPPVHGAPRGDALDRITPPPRPANPPPGTRSFEHDGTRHDLVPHANGCDVLLVEWRADDPNRFATSWLSADPASRRTCETSGTARPSSRPARR